jgi:DNA modification methylase
MQDDNKDSVLAEVAQEPGDSKIVISNYDCNDYIKNLPEKINVWITDPPYPFDNKNGKNRFNYVDGKDGMYDRMTYSDHEKVYKQMYDASEDSAMAYVFCSKDSIFQQKNPWIKQDGNTETHFVGIKLISAWDTIGEIKWNLLSMQQKENQKDLLQIKEICFPTRNQKVYLLNQKKYGPKY